ncbi:MAG: CHAD domain-containing protein, partial [Planctomycetota bacterium]
RGQLTRRRQRVTEDEAALGERLEEFGDRLREGRRRAETWELSEEGFDAIGPGLKKTYRRARKAMDVAREDGGAEMLHEWRKRAKYHWYHMRLLRDVWRPVVETRRSQVKAVSSSLGDDHNLAVLRQTIAENPEDFDGIRATQAFLGLIDRRRAALQAVAYRVGACVFAEKPKHLARRFHRYWEAWRGHIEVPVDEAAELAAAAES